MSATGAGTNLSMPHFSFTLTIELAVAKVVTVTTWNPSLVGHQIIAKFSIDINETDLFGRRHGYGRKGTGIWKWHHRGCLTASGLH